MRCLRVRCLHTEGLRNQVICCYQAQLLLPPKPSFATFVCFCCEPPLLLSLEGFLFESVVLCCSMPANLCILCYPLHSVLSFCSYGQDRRSLHWQRTWAWYSALAPCTDRWRSRAAGRSLAVTQLRSSSWLPFRSLQLG